MVIFLLIIGIKKRNYFSIILLTPYFIYSSVGILNNQQHFHHSNQKFINLQKMRHLNDANLSEIMTIVLNTKIVFGDGKCAGGLIMDLDKRKNVIEVLSKNNIPFDSEMAVIWLKDSSANRAIIGQDTLFLSDQMRDKEGIWMTTIKKDLVKHVKGMDGVNLSAKE